MTYENLKLQAKFCLSSSRRRKIKVSMKTFLFQCPTCAWSPSSRPPLFLYSGIFLGNLRSFLEPGVALFAVLWTKRVLCLSNLLQDILVIPAPPWDGRRQEQENRSGCAGRTRWPPALLKDGVYCFPKTVKLSSVPFVPALLNRSYFLCVEVGMSCFSSDLLFFSSYFVVSMC